MEKENDSRGAAQKFSELTALLLEYEKATLPLITCELDEVSEYIEARGRLMEKLREKNDELTAFCAAQGGQLAAAASCSCDRDTLPRELQEIFDARLEVSSVVTRLLSEERQAAERLTHERDGLISKIKDINNGYNAQASKYYDVSRYNADKYYFRQEPKKI